MLVTHKLSQIHLTSYKFNANSVTKLFCELQDIHCLLEVI